METVNDAFINSNSPNFCKKLFEFKCVICGDNADHVCLSCRKRVCMSCWNKKQSGCVECFPQFIDDAYASF
jgi:hypothetical protein